MKITIDQPFDIPGSTPQQRKIGGGASHPTQGLRYARAAWRALVEPFAPAKPVPKRTAVRLLVRLHYHTDDHGLQGEYKTTRPDADNLLKIIKDAMTKAGFWEDDAQTQDTCLRYWTNYEERVVIEAEEAE